MVPEVILFSDPGPVEYPSMTALIVGELVQVMRYTEPRYKISPPLGSVTVTLNGAVVGVGARVGMGVEVGPMAILNVLSDESVAT